MKNIFALMSEKIARMSDNDDNRFLFAASEPVCDTAVKNNSSEDGLKIQDASESSYECNRVVKNWIACYVLWKTMQQNIRIWPKLSPLIILRGSSSVKKAIEVTGWLCPTQSV